MEGQVKYIYNYCYYYGKKLPTITYHKVEKINLNFAKTAMRYYVKGHGYQYIPLGKTYTEDWYGERRVEGWTIDYAETHPHDELDD